MNIMRNNSSHCISQRPNLILNQSGNFNDNNPLFCFPWTCIQVALDQAAFLLDLATVNGSWDESREQLAAFYREAGFDQFAAFVALTDV